MDHLAFKSYVAANIDLLSGVNPESEDSFTQYETKLGLPLPLSMKWLLAEHGYSVACGVENLENSVKTTLLCRESIALPSNILIINDWNDGGVVFAIIDTTSSTEYEILWGGTSDLYSLIDGNPIPSHVTKFKDFAEWVVDRVNFERENSQ